MRLRDIAWAITGIGYFTIIHFKQRVQRFVEWNQGTTGLILLRQEILNLLYDQKIGFSKTEIIGKLEKQEKLYLLTKDYLDQALQELCEEGGVGSRLRVYTNCPGTAYDDLLHKHLPETTEYYYISP